ncbi:MAG: DUF4282 domain-containing protein [Candidatus Electrothrix sp. ATG1]|nr:DUF4282 domain-containing protein [Candidatus Electrothrix sp. ATG1]
MGFFKCPKCGYDKVKPGAEECEKCGVIFSKHREFRSKKNKNNKLKRCDACDSVISKRAEICPRCGDPQDLPSVQVSEFGKKGKKKFWGSLFDFSFSGFITTEIVKILYGISIFFSGVFIVVVIISSFGQSVGSGVISLIFSPVVFFLLVILVRMWLELVVVIFKIAENTSNIKK